MVAGSNHGSAAKGSATDLEATGSGPVELHTKIVTNRVEPWSLPATMAQLPKGQL